MRNLLISENGKQPSFSSQSSEQQDGNDRFWLGLGRAFMGALIFAVSLFMTMEMWWLGFYLDRLRFALFLIVNMALLVGLARVSGFKQNMSWASSAIDACIGYAVGFVTAGLFLYLFGVIDLSMSLDELVGKIALQAVPGSIGALLARSQLGDTSEKEQENAQGSSYGRELFIMIVGALFVAFTVAPTQEMILIAYKITPEIALGLVLISVVILHAMVYAVGFSGQEEMPESGGFWSVFIRFSVVGYAIVLLSSLYMLWTFGRLDGTSLHSLVMTTVVLSAPGAVGAAAARLIL